MPYDGLTRLTKHGPRWTGQVRFVSSMLNEPLGWRKPTRCFVNSMSDLFHEDLPSAQIAAVFGVMAACPHITFQVLTKRAERMRDWFAWMGRETAAEHGPDAAFVIRTHATNYGAELDQLGSNLWPLPNVWLGVSVENQATADERIPHLLRTPAAVRFLSIEPMLEAVDLGRYYLQEELGLKTYPFPVIPPEGRTTWAHMLDWVIVGSESGPRARPMDVEWARSIVRQCTDAGVRVFVKQIASEAARRAGDPKGGDPSFWAEDLRVRQFPAPHLPAPEVRHG